MSAEQWRPIPGFAGYEASDLGRVRSWRWRPKASTPRTLSPLKNARGYLFLRLRRDGEYHVRMIHQLVLAAFVGPPPDGLITRHLNGDPTDNALSNLKYGTHSENGLDRVAHGRNHWAERTHCASGHELAGDNLLAHSGNGSRRCRECSRLHSQRKNWKTRGLPKRMRGAA